MKRRKAKPYERYEFDASPWVQDLTQRDLASLLGMTKDQLERLVETKDRWIKRFDQEIGGKQRSLAVPTGRLRTVHERLKYHLNKIKQPDYLFSPRKGRSQRDNAAHHVGANQFLSIDIKQFYPSTKDEHIFRWAHHVAGLRGDVAGLFTHLVAIDGKMPFGSPISPVLTSHVHRPMFDAIDLICRAHGLKMSLWVDDLCISGTSVSGEVLTAIREVIAANGFKSHKIKFRTGAKPVIVTGVPIAEKRVASPKELQERIRLGYADLRLAEGDAERVSTINKLLSALGSYKYYLGSNSPEGRNTSNRMHALKQRRNTLNYAFTTTPSLQIKDDPVQDALPWD